MIPVILADDETLIRTALATMLDLEDDLSVVAHVASGEELVELWKTRSATGEPTAVAVIDLQLTGIDGIDTASQILAITPGAGTLIVTSHGRPGYLKRALAAGVRGFLPKTTSSANLAEVVRRVHAGGRYVDPELAAEAIGTGDSPLTDREADVLELALEGASIEDIAARAHVAPGTVRNYLSAAMAKLGTNNRYAAARKARELGWI
ncbi:response regulator transcription factor [Demetria terragena]|uniref:response regulator transcription factor n=1 Tax=Demetria terragena TaxID=63959 RepID=UPI000362496C|nr:response regulator transcription factor [Demetria terragena]